MDPVFFLLWAQPSLFFCLLLMLCICSECLLEEAFARDLFWEFFATSLKGLERLPNLKLFEATKIGPNLPTDLIFQDIKKFIKFFVTVPFHLCSFLIFGS